MPLCRGHLRAGIHDAACVPASSRSADKLVGRNCGAFPARARLRPAIGWLGHGPSAATLCGERKGRPPALERRARCAIYWSGAGDERQRRRRAKTVMSFSQSALWGVDTQNTRPYTPPIAEAAARKRGGVRSKPLRSKSNFASRVFSFRSLPKVENRVLTG
jgi:hypothetical protein